jgi:hypothetical protein
MPSAVKEHLRQMEKFIALSDDLWEEANEGGQAKVALFNITARMAELHNEAARTIMAAEEWEYLRAPLRPVNMPRRTQEVPLPAPGGHLHGLGTDPAPTAPPLPTDAPTGQKEE